MSEAWLECCRCHCQYAIGPLFAGCPACLAQGHVSPLEVEYRSFPPALTGLASDGMWRWSEWLPPVRPLNRVTLGEGSTPLLPIEVEGIECSLLFKNETMNPTWSWKDRPNATSASMAKEFGFSRVVAISTGNHGSAAAAYSARAGLGCTVFCHEDAPSLQLELMQSYGAEVIRGGGREVAARKLVEEDHFFPSTVLCPRSGIGNPYGVEGFKTIALEIVNDLGKAPDCVFVPVGSGDGIYGIWKGFRELQKAGIVAQPPRMIACQSCGADSAVQAFARGSGHVQPVTVSTAALSIGESVVGDHAMRAIYESHGEAIAVPDSEISVAARRLAKLGFSVEMSSATSLACAVRFAARSKVAEAWVLIGSGASVKWPSGQ